MEEKLPIIYCSHDFEQVVIDQHFLSSIKGRKFFGLNDKRKLLEGLKTIDGDLDQLGELKQSFPGCTEAELLIEILKLDLLDQSFLNLQPSPYHNELNYRNDIVEMFKKKLKELDHLLKNNDYFVLTNEKLNSQKKEQKNYLPTMQNYFGEHIEKHLERKEKFFRVFEQMLKLHKTRLNLQEPEGIN